MNENLKDVLENDPKSWVRELTINYLGRRERENWKSNVKEKYIWKQNINWNYF